MGYDTDDFRSPLDQRREYSVIGSETNLNDADLRHTHDVTVIDINGSTEYTKEQIEIDRGKLNPRLGRRSLTDTITSANERWVLGDDTPFKGCVDA